jgi:hypothetical protein
MVNKNYVVALNLTGAAVDDPDSMLKEALRPHGAQATPQR